MHCTQKYSLVPRFRQWMNCEGGREVGGGEGEEMGGGRVGGGETMRGRGKGEAWRGDGKGCRELVVFRWIIQYGGHVTNTAVTLIHPVCADKQP